MKKLEQLAEVFENEAVIFLSVRDFAKIENELEEITRDEKDSSDWYGKGANHGVFDNSKDKAEALGFISVYINGKTHHLNTEHNLMKMINHL